MNMTQVTPLILAHLCLTAPD